jgi:hypothetical protein
MYGWTYLTWMTYTVVERMQICGWNQLDCEMVMVDWCLPKDDERRGHFGMWYTWVVALWPQRKKTEILQFYDVAKVVIIHKQIWLYMKGKNINILYFFGYLHEPSIKVWQFFGSLGLMFKNHWICDKKFQKIHTQKKGWNSKWSENLNLQKVLF